MFSGTPSDISQDTDSSSSTATVTWTPPTASDNANEGVTLTSDHDPGDTFPIGTTTVTYTATDPYSNMDTDSFDVIVSGKIEILTSGFQSGKILMKNAVDFKNFTSESICVYCKPKENASISI